MNLLKWNFVILRVTPAWFRPVLFMLRAQDLSRWYFPIHLIGTAGGTNGGCFDRMSVFVMLAFGLGLTLSWVAYLLTIPTTLNMYNCAWPP